jgi:hypothetical protein
MRRVYHVYMNCWTKVIKDPGPSRSARVGNCSVRQFHVHATCLSITLVLAFLVTAEALYSIVRHLVHALS